ncbi:unnamed protein product [Vitrella brassicaformis CCMP3155]|uniref:Uncharacterized protein n=2 Tax=Vitrella brassicaformis TaxID=1169539 RepID=A0A0G4FQJ3_VITBC|nr:unnamed protein product [Vitrella brassicaformis CCMP3155]|eukprot:CEM16708.1 unnamed protein product [Vitrella brassicaformis CCMP3155]
MGGGKAQSQLKEEFVHEHRENSASFNMGGGYTNRFYTAKLQGATMGGAFHNVRANGCAKRFLRCFRRGFRHDGSHENTDLGIAELPAMLEFTYGRDNGFDFYYMDKHKLHRLDNYNAFHTVSNHTRGSSGRGRSTVQFPIEDMAPELDDHLVPTADEVAQVKERLRRVSPKSAEIFESFGGDYDAMTRMPIDEACKYHDNSR